MLLLTEMSAENTSHQHLYAEFLQWQSLGVKANTTSALRVFIDSLSNLEAKAAWVDANLEDLIREGHRRIRHELYEEVVLPVLSERCREGQAEAKYQLATLRHNSGRVDPRQLLLEAYEAVPGEPRYSQALLTDLIAEFQYLDHEWPAGILIDTRAPDVWHELFQDINLARKLDEAGEQTDRLNLFEERVRQYWARITAAT
jgi:hypothetical protein